MADGAVQSVIQLLVPLINSEVTLIAGLADDIKAIKTELDDISALLKNADKRAEGDASVKQWVKKVRILACDIEDVIEEYQLLQKENKLVQAMQTLRQRKRTVAVNIKKIRERANEIHRAREFYRLDNNLVEPSRHQDAQVTRPAPCIPEDCELIGAQKPKEEIIELIGLDKMDLRRETIAVLGMRGLGKTTVVGSVYNDRLVRDYFPIRAWIVISQPCIFTELLRSMMKQFCEAAREMARLERACMINQVQNNGSEHNLDEINSMGEISLQNAVREYLKNKRYMVVFDDVQEDSIELANYVKRVLPANSKGSKILVTTRYGNVAHAWLEGSYNNVPYKLKPLTSENAWELFCKKTFQISDVREYPPWLDGLAHGFVERCEGLPPAILAMGCFLSTKQNDQNEWQKVYDNLGYYLEKDSLLKGIYTIFIRDYLDLKPYLKPCLIYFGLFPKGCSVNRIRLIRLWIAEGFIIEKGSMSLEEAAEDYLEELINTCLVEVVCTDPTGKPRSLRVHEFLHEIILYKLNKELGFCQIVSKSDAVLIEQPRRLSIQKDSGSNVNKVLENITQSHRSNIRSIFLIKQEIHIVSQVLNEAFLKKVYLLKVLDLSDAPIDAIPKAVGKLLNLRYFSIRNTRVGKIPSSIGKLQNLQTLDLKLTLVNELPTEISKLHNLRHLLAYRYLHEPKFSCHAMRVEGVKMPGGALGKFVELQKLAFVDATHGARWLIEELRNLKQLRKLGIVNLKETENVKDLCVAMECMERLQALSILAKNKSDMINFLEHMKSPPPTLKRLYLNGRLMSIPSCIMKLDGLLKVRLRWSSLRDDPLEILQGLPNLIELQLLEAHDGPSLSIGNEGFQKLKILQLLDLRNLKSLNISKQALPLLEEMSIGESPNLIVPIGIQCVRKLKKLRFYGMPESFCRSIRRGGEYDSIIEHVPNVFFHSKHTEGYWTSDKL